MGKSLYFFILFSLINFNHGRNTDPRCDQMRIPWCANAYDSVIFPNFLGHKNQEEAYYAMHKLWPLIQSRCSTEISAYLCRLYAPQCPYLVKDRNAEYVTYYQPEQAKPPCQQSCLRVKKDCQRILKERGIEWPPELECHRLRQIDCYERPTVVVRPTQMALNGGKHVIDWDVETITIYRTTTGSWIPPERPTTTTRQPIPSTTTPRPTTIRWTTPVPTSTTPKSIPSTTTVKPTTTKLQSTKPNPTTTKQAPMTTTTPAPSMPSITEKTTTMEKFMTSPVATTEKVETTTTRMLPLSTQNLLPTSMVKLFSTPQTTTKTFPKEMQEKSTETNSLFFVANNFSSFENEEIRNLSSENTNITTDPPVISIMEMTPLIQEDTEASINSEESDPIDYIAPDSTKIDPYEGESSDEIRFHLIYQPSPSKCEPLILPGCQNFGYNMTNIDEEMQNIAAIQLYYFSPLVQVKCSDHLETFLCAAYAPPCKGLEKNENLLPPCRSFCQSAKSDCEELISKLGFRWPDELDCEKYSINEDKCISGLTAVEEEEEAIDQLIPPPSESLIRPSKSELSVPKISILPTRSIRPTTTLMPANLQEEGNDRCEPILSQVCNKLRLFNQTQLPNIFGHIDQLEADLAMNQYMPLIEVNCSPNLSLFLCTLHVPPCPIRNDQTDRLPESIISPCRSLCQSVEKGCKPLLKMFGFSWPSNFECDRFPNDHESTTCIKSNESIDQTTTIKSISSTTEIPDMNKRLRALEALKETAPLNPRCEKLIETSMCHGFYEKTIFPNIFSHATQTEAEIELRQYQPLIKVNCSPNLKSLLCFVYNPVCTVLEQPIPPCRELCLEAKNSCEPLMTKFGFRWPTHINCSQYPSRNSENGELCFDNEKMTTTTTRVSVITTESLIDSTTGAKSTRKNEEEKLIKTVDMENVSVKNNQLHIDLGENFSDAPRADAALSSGNWNDPLGKVIYLIGFLYLCGMRWM